MVEFRVSGALFGDLLPFSSAAKHGASCRHVKVVCCFVGSEFLLLTGRNAEV